MFQSLATLNQTLRQSRECKASWVLRSTEVWNRHFVAPGKSSKQSPVWALKSPSRQRLPGDNCYLGTKKEALNHPPTLQSSQSPLGIELCPERGDCALERREPCHWADRSHYNWAFNHLGEIDHPVPLCPWCWVLLLHWPPRFT